jgi:hypothetical protein
MMKFKILPKVKSFSDAHGNEYYPGDVVDLPVSYLGESWLEPVDKVDIKKPESRIEPIAEKVEKEAVAPLETPKTQKKVKKKLKS